MKSLQTSGIYQIICTENGAFYIGSTYNFHKRWGNHKSYLRRGKHSNIHLQRCFDKYGEASLEFQILEECSKEMLLALEQTYIDKFILMPGFLNIAKDSSAPTTGKILTEEHKKKISDAHKGVDRPHKYLPRSEETKEKIAEYNRTKRVYKPHTEETKLQISEKKKGVKMTEQAKKNMSESRKASWQTKEYRLSHRRKGAQN